MIVDILRPLLDGLVCSTGGFRMVAAVATTALVGSVAARVIYSTFFCPLRHIPGPFLVRISDMFLYWPRSNGKIHEVLERMHRQYGPVVYYGPGKVSVADVQAIKPILERYPKARRYAALARVLGREDLFTVIDPDKHHHLRRIFSPAFSLAYLNSLEQYIHLRIKSMLNHIRAACNHPDEDAVVDMWGLLQRLALDVIGETSFGESFYTIENGSHPLPQSVRTVMKKTAICALVPGISCLVNIKPELQYTEEFMNARIRTRRECVEEKRKDLLQFLLDARDNKQNNLDDIDVLRQAVIFLIAGSDSTAITMFNTLLFLIKHPETLQRLRLELNEAVCNVKEEVPPHEILKNLDFLNAVLKETMRLRPIVVAGVAREAPEDVEILGYAIPKGTSVIANLSWVQTDPKVWGADTLEFRPERFLEEYPKDAFYPFSAGTRNCIGQNFAMIELRSAVAALLLHFDIELPAEEQSEELVGYITLGLKSNRYKMRLRPRSRL
ncbi:uncharacterized protein VTP21DRAFT_4518 [Calcarisporiella thermophila]|uniref:uncharacterized protein n=1 Tax=Calcarisporiella thermophila TaxID=911321 RepID=UPI0037428A9D